MSDRNPTTGVHNAKLNTKAATTSGRMPGGIGSTMDHMARKPTAIAALTNGWTRIRSP